jgi:hypothetical protein
MAAVKTMTRMTSMLAALCLGNAILIFHLSALPTEEHQSAELRTADDVHREAASTAKSHILHCVGGL